MRKAIITGANGFVGGATLRELLDHSYEIWAIGHQKNFSNVPEDPLVHRISCNLEEMGSLTEKIPAGDYDLFTILLGLALQVRQEQIPNYS